MHTFLVDLLACPVCHGELRWQIAQADTTRIQSARISCASCGAEYCVEDEIGLFLAPSPARDDLWEQAESGLARYLSEQPAIARRLLDDPLDSLGPADQLFRALALEERGDFGAAQAAAEHAMRGLYTAEYLAGWESQSEYVSAQLAGSAAPVVDLASGRCYLVERLARACTCPLVATDFSPRVLHGDKRRLEFLGLYDRVSLLALDARQMPFKPGAIAMLTTNLGLPNISAPGPLLHELRRVVGGHFLAIAQFYPEDDTANLAAAAELGLAEMLTRGQTLERIGEAGWRVRVANACTSDARPTPTGIVLEGAAIDRLPVAATTLEWCVLHATTA
jgi:uncharacterized protein YbaR (Trm112 family)